MVKVYKNWLRLIAYRLGILPQPMTILTRDGARFRIRDRRGESADAYVINECYLYGIHDKLLPYLKSAKVGLDIGAHIGSFSIFAATQSPAMVYAFEPADNNLALLRENIRLNRLEGRVVPVEEAVSSKTGTLDLYVNQNSGLISTTKGHIELYGAPGGVRATVKAPATSLADFFAKRNIEFCDFMKVDCEGGEYDIFYNLPQHIFNKIGVMSIECHADADLNELAAFIRKQGFDVERPSMEFGEIFCRNTAPQKSR